MDNKIFKQDAKTIVDLFFDIKIFKDEVTRDDMNTLEELINSTLCGRFDSYKKMDSLMAKIEKSKGK